MATDEKTWSDCLITTRIASGCKTCGAESSDENPTHVWHNAFYCRLHCGHCSPAPKEWKEPAPVIGEQVDLF